MDAGAGHQEFVDVLIVGAGISGIGAAYYLQRDHPGRRYLIVEARGASGGTWDLFRYPGVRSDSDLHTFGYEFRPWRSEVAIADSASILAYLRETAAEYGIDEHIRYHTQVTAASWSSADARWTVTVQDAATGEQSVILCNWLLCAAGYYRYDEGFTPRFEGRERFAGPVIHPQHWPQDLDYAGKRVVVIGSGATAVTLIPAMAQAAAHVTMLQRTPSYVLPVPSRDAVNARLTAWFGDERGYSMTRWINSTRQVVLWRFCQKHPKAARRLIRNLNKRMLPEDYPVDEHFNPPYGPWDQRMCIVPDGDLFRAIRDGNASVVTGHIETFTENGVQLIDGRRLEADIIVTATGLNVQALGGMTLTVDGSPVHAADQFVYKGMMLSGVPNFVFVFGYTNASWTLKIGSLCQHFCRLLSYLDSRGYNTARPVAADPGMQARPFTDFGSGYIKRALAQLPRQGSRAPWRISPTHRADARQLRRRVDGPELNFSSALSGGSPSGSTEGVRAGHG
ncbi:MAG TPA: NAD(P)/FAD-dependent oxidoreductase [Trebonia sp.]|nr:NAD(P)/FAD-dependent oxidoreductase [Trebonia sp.]